MSPRVKLCAEVSAAVSTALAVKIVCIATPRNCARYSRARFATRKPATSSVTLFGLRNCGGSSSPPDWRGRLAPARRRRGRGRGAAPRAAAGAFGAAARSAAESDAWLLSDVGSATALYDASRVVRGRSRGRWPVRQIGIVGHVGQQVVGAGQRLGDGHGRRQGSRRQRGRRRGHDGRVVVVVAAIVAVVVNGGKRVHDA